MFPRRKRLPRALFPSAMKGGRRTASANFSAVFPAEAAGYAVVVSKKTARLSVTRHRLKRRSLAALRTIGLPPALILFPKASANNLSAQETREELATLLSKYQ